LFGIPPWGRAAQAKKEEAEICNPDNLDVFTEEEAQYQASLLQQNQYKE
jgi:hypothetical protein